MHAQSRIGAQGLSVLRVNESEQGKQRGENRFHRTWKDLRVSDKCVLGIWLWVQNSGER